MEFIIWIAITIIILAGYWKTYEKAGEPGWAILVPFYNIIVLLRIVGKPWWWLLLLLVPILNIIIGVVISIRLAKNFGYGVPFGLGLLFLSFIFVPILGFGSAQYRPVE
ncbi:hypothetical protein SAMN02745704_00547 [Paucidesulfovibrio gracilis DSM 16080]|uniref:Signal peptidase I n=1 Tax=Paucidesulfovibrio gracilis DSM 16080 TaxID=1121449 RepID=A0A1T4W9K2_9BACT|nr:DUF5684 domain-containing protein [Paucidesulfovibrio gracilis]SKA73867.1 hypothetical protein SAMN02745704_00547 [Paucidesulfovibrio gracilis DSM 16080]